MHHEFVRIRRQQDQHLFHRELSALGRSVVVVLLPSLGLLLLLTGYLEGVVEAFTKIQHVFVTLFHTWFFDLLRPKLTQDIHGPPHNPPIQQLDRGKVRRLLWHLSVGKQKRVDVPVPMSGLLTAQATKAGLQGRGEPVHQSVAHRVVQVCGFLFDAKETADLLHAI
ncbi:hypothetical protein PoB_006011400 [Plakobranchus ocellatus]|uniref:Uncharacterized protein n=1 Tax=Plakobranchus ocellatus TaxID=259542 RepID=A0AAV4CP12_9GAST|nr:hypothetical protein PoB_006011400 [Plakobranchus ocellatus]